jgi:hypothetical protein
MLPADPGLIHVQQEFEAAAVLNATESQSQIGAWVVGA